MGLKKENRLSSNSAGSPLVQTKGREGSRVSYRVPFAIKP
jgi:hypothetical protein